jgi:cobalt/nickel transport system permease protein
VSHLHVPDGVLPVALWAPGLALALLLLFASLAATRRRARPAVGFQAALGGLMLAVMSIPVPIFALEYCLTLAGPIGVLLGAAAGYQTVFVVCVILALLGQGGVTVVGLNAIVLGAGVALARPAYRAMRARFGPAPSLAAATAVTQLGAGLLWLVLLAAAARIAPGALLGDTHGHARVPVLAGVTLAVWALSIGAESFVAYGIGRFLSRVRPDLLPGAKEGRS